MPTKAFPGTMFPTYGVAFASVCSISFQDPIQACRKLDSIRMDRIDSAWRPHPVLVRIYENPWSDWLGRAIHDFMASAEAAKLLRGSFHGL